MYNFQVIGEIMTIITTIKDIVIKIIVLLYYKQVAFSFYLQCNGGKKCSCGEPRSNIISNCDDKHCPCLLKPCYLSTMMRVVPYSPFLVIV